MTETNRHSRRASYCAVQGYYPLLCASTALSVHHAPTHRWHSPHHAPTHRWHSPHHAPTHRWHDRHATLCFGCETYVTTASVQQL